MDFLLERQRLAWKGEGQIVLISGEAGIGKSRLAAALAQASPGNRTRDFVTNAHPTMPTARFIHLSTNWNERRGSKQTIRPGYASTSWKRYSP